MNALLEATRELDLDPKELLLFAENPRDLIRIEPDIALRHQNWAVLKEAEFVADQAAKKFNREKQAAVRQLLKQLEIPMIIGGGGGQTQTYSELLFASITTGTQLSGFTTEDNLMKTIPGVILPAGYFYNLGAAGKAIRIKAIGRLGTTGTPTFTWSVRLRTNRTWAADGVVISSAAITCGSGVTLAPWFLDFEIICRALVDGSTGLTLAMMGELRGGTSLAAGGGVYSMPAANTAFTVTLDNTATQYVYLSAACGSNSGSNLIQVEMLKVYGEN